MQDILLIAKALSDENRILFLQTIAQGELCACKILEKLSITQPTLSHHAKILEKAKLINTRKQGKWSHYSINKKTLQHYQNFLQELQKGQK